MKVENKLALGRAIHKQYPSIALDMDVDWRVGVLLFKVGMKEVVEWVRYCPQCGGYLPKNLPLVCRYCSWNGQAKLKEWGIEEENDKQAEAYP